MLSKLDGPVLRKPGLTPIARKKREKRGLPCEDIVVVPSRGCTGNWSSGCLETNNDGLADGGQAKGRYRNWKLNISIHHEVQAGIALAAFVGFVAKSSERAFNFRRRQVHPVSVLIDITIAFQEFVRLACTTALLDCGDACSVEDANDLSPPQQQPRRRTTTRTTRTMDDFDDSPSSGNEFDANARVRKWAGQLAQSAAHTVQELTSRKYALPDKNVASQLLMYRQVPSLRRRKIDCSALPVVGRRRSRQVRLL